MAEGVIKSRKAGAEARTRHLGLLIEKDVVELSQSRWRAHALQRVGKQWEGDNNYVGAVKRLTAISAQLAELDFAKAPNFLVNGLKREELIATNSMILHEIYFDGLGGGGAPSGALADAIARDFGSVDRWRTEFSAMGKAEGGGSGWVILAYSPRDKRLVNQWAADHTTTLAGGRPILVLDMYEHAYHMDYGAAAARYVDVFMEAIRWDNAVKLYDQYSREA